MNEPKEYKITDKFDRMLGGLHNLPDVISTKPSTVVAVLPLIGQAQTYIIQTLRQREKGDTIFVQYVDDRGSVRLVIPPAAAEAIARQRDSLTTKARKRPPRNRLRHARHAARFLAS
jgi:hypothetical protein